MNTLYGPDGRYFHEKEFVAYVRGVIDSEKQRMKYEHRNFSKNISALVGKSESKLPKFAPPPPPKIELIGPLKLIEEALNKLQQ